MVSVPGGNNGGHNRKRSDLKLGRPQTSAAAAVAAAGVTKPEVDAESCVQPPLKFPPGVRPPLAMTKNIWAAMAVSGYTEVFTAADWTACILKLVVIDDFIRGIADGKGWTAMKASEVNSMIDSMLLQESARRRLKIEVQRKSELPEIAIVAPIDRAKAAGL
jgi:hypothetical protein